MPVPGRPDLKGPRQNPVLSWFFPATGVATAPGHSTRFTSDTPDVRITMLSRLLENSFSSQRRPAKLLQQRKGRCV